MATATTKRTSITKALNVRLTIRREVLERMYINAKRRNFHFLSELGRSPLEFAFRKDRPYLTPWATWNNYDTVEAFLMDTLVSGQLYLRPPSKNLFFSTPIQTLYVYGHLFHVPMMSTHDSFHFMKFKRTRIHTDVVLVFFSLFSIIGERVRATPLRWRSINSPRSTDFEEKIEGLWIGYFTSNVCSRCCRHIGHHNSPVLIDCVKKSICTVYNDF